MNRFDLKKYKANKEFIEKEIQRIEEDKLNVNKLTSVLSDMPKGTPSVQDNMAEKLVALMDKENELLDKMIAEREELNLIIEQLKGMKNVVQRNLLYDYYILGNTLEDFASEHSYEYGYVKHLHGWALNEYDKGGNE